VLEADSEMGHLALKNLVPAVPGLFVLFCETFGVHGVTWNDLRKLDRLDRLLKRDLRYASYILLIDDRLDHESGRRFLPEAGWRTRVIVVRSQTAAEETRRLQTNHRRKYIYPRT